jgi:predicted O-methyltransferase YrrM
MEQVLSYLQAAHPPPHPLLLELERRGREDGVPIVSREIGRLLSTIVTSMQANRILEVGTGYGYTTLWMALAQPPMGKIWTIEADARRTDVALSFFARAAENEHIEVFNTPALELLENFPHRNLDVVFIGANKNEYRAYLDLVIPTLKLSGLVIVHDCLLGGRIASPTSLNEEDSVGAMREFNRYFLTHPALDATILPLGDGAGIGARKR